MQRLIFLGHYLVSDALNKFLDPRVFGCEVGIVFLQIPQREYHLLGEFLDSFCLKLGIIIMVYLHLRHITFFQPPRSQFFDRKPVQCHAIRWIVKSAIVNKFAYRDRQHFRDVLVKFLFSHQLLMQHVMLKEIELVVLFLLSFEHVPILFTHIYNPVIWIDYLVVSGLMHVLELVRPRRVYRPSRYLLALRSCLTHIPYSRWHLSFLERIVNDFDFFSVLISPRVINNLFVQPFLVLFKLVDMLAFESHLHFLVGVRYQLPQFFDLLGVCHHLLIFLDLVCKSMVKLLEAFLFWSLVQVSQKLGVLVFYLLNLRIVL